MNPSRFFARAFDDAAFRRAQLDDLRYSQKVGIGLVAFCSLLGIAASVYGGLENGDWESGLSLLGVALLGFANYATNATTLAALETIDARASLNEKRTVNR